MNKMYGDGRNQKLVAHLNCAVLVGPAQVAIQAIATGTDRLIDLSNWRVTLGGKSTYRASQLVELLKLDSFVAEAMTPQVRALFMVPELHMGQFVEMGV